MPYAHYSNGNQTIGTLSGLSYPLNTSGATVTQDPPGWTTVSGNGIFIPADGWYTATGTLTWVADSSSGFPDRLVRLIIGSSLELDKEQIDFTGVSVSQTVIRTAPFYATTADVLRIYGNIVGGTDPSTEFSGELRLDAATDPGGETPRFCKAGDADATYFKLSIFEANPSGTRMFALGSDATNNEWDYVQAFDVAGESVTLDTISYVQRFAGTGVRTRWAATDSHLWLRKGTTTLAEFYTVPLTGGGTPTLVDDYVGNGHNVLLASASDRIYFFEQGGTELYQVTAGGGVAYVEDFDYPVSVAWVSDDGVIWGWSSNDTGQFRHVVGVGSVHESQPLYRYALNPNRGCAGDDPAFTDSFWCSDLAPGAGQGGRMIQYAYDGTNVFAAAVWYEDPAVAPPPHIEGTRPYRYGSSFTYTKNESPRRRWVGHAPGFIDPNPSSGPTYGEIYKWGTCGGWVLNRMSIA